VRYSVLQCAAMSCSTLYYATMCSNVCCSELRSVVALPARQTHHHQEFHVAVCCALQCDDVWCSVLQRDAVCYIVLQCAEECCSVLQCAAGRCSALQRVAVCYGVLQGVTVR